MCSCRHVHTRTDVWLCRVHAGMSAKAVSEASGKHVLATAGVIDEYRTACVDAASTPASLLAAHPWLASSRVCLVLIEYTSQGRGDIFEVYFIILLKPHSSAC